MNIEPEELRQYYASLSDDVLMAIDTADLVEVAKRYYDEEVSRRGLPRDSPVSEEPSAGESSDGLTHRLRASEDIQADSHAHLRSIRKAALVACVATVLGLLVPTWTSVHQMLAVNPNGARWWIPPSIAFMLILSALSPLFYFALYLDRGDLRISRSLRLLSVGAALVLALLVAFRVPSWIESFKSASVLSQNREPWTMDDTSTLLGISSDLGTIILLIALYRQRERHRLEHPVSTVLRITTKISVIVFGVATAIAVIRLVLTPYWSAPLHDAMIQAGRTPPPLSYFVIDSIRTVFVQACSLVAPFVVWFSSPKVRSENGEFST